jgi:polyvinyl alcohol dehydrogenase (cytochrome)
MGNWIRAPRVLGAAIGTLILAAACDSRTAEPPPHGVAAVPVNEALDPMTGAVVGAGAQAGEALYLAHCAQCHSGETHRAPHRMFLEMLAPRVIERTLIEGVMQQHAAGLERVQIHELAAYLTGGAGTARTEPQRCAPGDNAFDFDQPPFASGWGVDRENSRHIPSESARLGTPDIPRLRLKWAFAYPGATRARSQPSFAGGGLFVGSQDGTLYALDAGSGCVRWAFDARAEIRTGLTISAFQRGDTSAQPVLYFGDLLARVYAVSALSGELLWSTRVDDHPSATVTAQPVLLDDRLYVTVSSLEVVPAADPDYPCCTFRGSVTALDAVSGTIEWKSYTIPEVPVEVARNRAGTPMMAPSGAPSWNSPTIDLLRGQGYFGTGENYSSPAQGSSDAIIAFGLDRGEIRWVRQTTAGDAWNLACMPFVADQTNCPKERGPDVDYAAPPILVRGDGQDILVAGQKSGDVYGLDPDTGEVVWHQRVGRGGNQGGVHFSMAASGRSVFVPISDYDDAMLPLSEARPGLYALDAFTGEYLWQAPADNVCGERKDCDPGISAAITATDGVVWAGHMDGRLRAYAADDGRVLWEHDTTREVRTLSGEMARGGSMGGGSGPMILNGMVYANSGYGLYFHMPGNVLLAFSVDGK